MQKTNEEVREQLLRLQHDDFSILWSRIQSLASVLGVVDKLEAAECARMTSSASVAAAHRMVPCAAKFSCDDPAFGAAVAKGYDDTVDRCVGELLQAIELWDGRAETKAAAARESVGRVRIQAITYTDRPPEAWIVLDGEAVSKIRLCIEAISGEPEAEPHPAT